LSVLERITKHVEFGSCVQNFKQNEIRFIGGKEKFILI